MIKKEGQLNYFDYLMQTAFTLYVKRTVFIEKKIVIWKFQSQDSFFSNYWLILYGYIDKFDLFG